MARELLGETIACRPAASNTFSATDNDRDTHIPVSLADSDGVSLPEPTVAKAVDDGIIYGKLVVWDAGAAKATVMTTGVLQFTVAAAIQATDFGKGIVGAGGNNVKVSGTARQGTGRIVARNDTTIWVDLNKAPDK